MKAMFCSKCGCKVGDGAQFCPSCGAAIESVESDRMVSSSTVNNTVPPKDESSAHRGWATSAFWAVFGLVVLGISLYFAFGKNIVASSAGQPTTDDGDAVEEKMPLEEERPRIETGATERLPSGPQTVTTIITTTGKGENAKWGLKTSGSFVLTYHIVCDSEIMEKSETPVGDIKVVEKRTFREMRQVLEVSEVDVGFAIPECLPMKSVMAVCAAFPGAAGVAAAIGAGAKMLEGKSARGLLGAFGCNGLTAMFEEKVNKFLKNRVNELFKTADIEGKTFIVTYLQDHTDGKPSMMKGVHEDGSPLSQDERLVLRRANVFMDSQFMPDSSCSPGDSWKINSDEFSCLLDPYINGNYDGEVTVSREDDDKDGNWKLGVKPTTVAIKSDGGKTTGSMELSDGVAWYDNRGHNIVALQLNGKGAMKNLTHHHFLFTARLEGMCKFSAIMKTEPKQ